MLSMLIAYDDEGNVIATLDHLVRYDEAMQPVGLVDFAEHEAAGGALTDIWNVEGAAGSATWPEWLGYDVVNFRVEVDEEFSRHKARGERPEHRIKALVHKGSGYRRERSEIESRIAKRIKQAKGGPADIRDIVGGPGRPLKLTSTGRNARRKPVVAPVLPVVSRGERVGAGR